MVAKADEFVNESSLLRRHFHIVELDRHFVRETNEEGQIFACPLIGEIPIIMARDEAVAIKDNISRRLLNIRADGGKVIIPMFDVDIVVNSGSLTDLDVEAAYNEYCKRQVEVENQLFTILKNFDGKGVMYIRNFTVMPNDSGGWKFTDNIGVAKVK